MKQSWANKSSNEFLKIYIHEGCLFVCFVPMVHETYQFGLLAVRCCTSFDIFLALKSKWVLLLIMMTHHHSIHHVVMESNITWINYEHYIIDVENHVPNQRVSFFCVTSTWFLLLKVSVIYLMNTIIATKICYSPLVSLWIGYLYSNLLHNIKISSFVKKLLLLFISTMWEKTQINSTTYCTYGRKKKWTQTFPYCNYGNKDRVFVQQASMLQNVKISAFVK